MMARQLFIAEDLWRAAVWGIGGVFVGIIIVRNHIKKMYRPAIVSGLALCVTGFVEWSARAYVRVEGHAYLWEDWGLLLIVTLRTLAITWAVYESIKLAWSWPHTDDEEQCIKVEITD